MSGVRAETQRPRPDDSHLKPVLFSRHSPLGAFPLYRFRVRVNPDGLLTAVKTWSKIVSRPNVAKPVTLLLHLSGFLFPKRLCLEGELVLLDPHYHAAVL